MCLVFKQWCASLIRVHVQVLGEATLTFMATMCVHHPKFGPLLAEYHKLAKIGPLLAGHHTIPTKLPHFNGTFVGFGLIFLAKKHTPFSPKVAQNTSLLGARSDPAMGPKKDPFPATLCVTWLL